jgi:putative PIG3 family NAD(P)H quinone oxidoreductase
MSDHRGPSLYARPAGGNLIGMRAVIAATPGGPEVLEIVERPVPEARPDELLVRNFAAALNRADILQRRGLYPPPPGASDILGLEFAGEVAEAGATATGFRRGDRVFGIVPGGAYAEFLTIHHRLALPIPDTFSYEKAAATPEAFITAYEGLFTLGRLAAGEWVLVHAGASGVGSAAIQLAAARGIHVVATAGTAEKTAECRRLGAAEAVNHREGDFVAAVARATGGRGADAVFDLVGAKYWEQNLACLREGGRLAVIGLVGGARVTADLGIILRRRLTIAGTALRARSLDDKLEIAGRFAREVLPLLASGRLQPVLDRVFPFEEARAAHERMEANLNTGKIILRL